MERILNASYGDAAQRAANRARPDPYKALDILQAHKEQKKGARDDAQVGANIHNGMRGVSATAGPACAPRNHLIRSTVSSGCEERVRCRQGQGISASLLELACAWQANGRL